MIVLDHLSKTYVGSAGAHEALRDINLHVEPGDVFGIIGQSGAGKSTLVRCINLLERPTAGRVLIDGADVTDYSGKQLIDLRQSIGMIFQNFSLFAQRTVLRNVTFPLELHGTPKKQAEARALELLELVGLSGKANNYPSQLSGGQQQRVAIARALASNPKIMLCDEATSALDTLTTHSILGLLRDINKELGVTMVVITPPFRLPSKFVTRWPSLRPAALPSKAKPPMCSAIRRAPQRACSLKPTRASRARKGQLMEAIDAFIAQYGALMAQGTWDAIVMTVLSTLFAYVIGIPVGVLLVLTEPGGLHPHRIFNSVLGWIVNIMRSIPFIILIVFMIPFTRAIVGTSLGVGAAIVPLTVSAAPFVARMVEQSLAEIDGGLVEAAQSFGASTWQIISKVLLPEKHAVFGARPVHYVHHAVRLHGHGRHGGRGRHWRHRHSLWLPALSRRRHGCGHRAVRNHRANRAEHLLSHRPQDRPPRSLIIFRIVSPGHMLALGSCTTLRSFPLRNLNREGKRPGASKVQPFGLQEGKGFAMNLKNVVRIAACAAATGVLAVALVGCGSSSSQHQIAVPSDATNEARALLLLQDEGLLTLNDGAGALRLPPTTSKKTPITFSSSKRKLRAFPVRFLMLTLR